MDLDVADGLLIGPSIELAHLFGFDGSKHGGQFSPHGRRDSRIVSGLVGLAAATPAEDGAGGDNHRYRNDSFHRINHSISVFGGRGGSVAPPAHHAMVFSRWWISCKLHTRMGSRRRAATASAAARAPLMVVMQGTR